MGYGVNSFFDV